MDLIKSIVLVSYSSLQPNVHYVSSLLTTSIRRWMHACWYITNSYYIRQPSVHPTSNTRMCVVEALSTTIRHPASNCNYYAHCTLGLACVVAVLKLLVDDAHFIAVQRFVCLSDGCHTGESLLPHTPSLLPWSCKVYFAFMPFKCSCPGIDNIKVASDSNSNGAWTPQSCITVNDLLKKSVVEYAEPQEGVCG